MIKTKELLGLALAGLMSMSGISQIETKVFTDGKGSSITSTALKESKVVVKPLGVGSFTNGKFNESVYYYARFDENIPTSNSISVDVVNENLGLVNNLNFHIEEGGMKNALFGKDVFLSGDKFHVICYRWNAQSKENKKEGLEIVSFDLNGNRLNSEAFELSSLSAVSRIKGPKYSWQVSPNGKFFGVISSPMFNRKEKEKLTISIYEVGSWKKVSSKELLFDVLDSRKKSNQFFVDDHGNGLFLKTEKVDKKIIKSWIGVLKKDGSFKKEELGESFKFLPATSSNNNGLQLNGTLSAKYDKNAVIGYYQFRINSAGDLTCKQTKVWTREEIHNFASSGKGFPIVNISLKLYFDDVQISDIKTLKNGNTAILFSGFKEKSVEVIEGVFEYVYEFNKFVTMCLDKDGNVVWQNIASPQQTFKSKTINIHKLMSPRLHVQSGTNQLQVLWSHNKIRYNEYYSERPRALGSKHRTPRIFIHTMDFNGKVIGETREKVPGSWTSSKSTVTNMNGHEFGLPILSTMIDLDDNKLIFYLNQVEKPLKNYHYFRWIVSSEM